jgi:RNA polymerase sigma factor (sigma-70 family)
MNQNSSHIEKLLDSKNRLVLDSSTNLELIASLQTNASPPWPIFVQKYTRLLHRWCNDWQAKQEDKEDAVQETLLELFQKINDYKFNPETTFRAWLRKVAYYRYLRIIKKNRRTTSFTDTTSNQTKHGDQNLQSALACDSFMKLIDLIADQEIIEIACLRIAKRVDKEHWTIFCRKEMEGIPSKTLASEHGISSNAVDVITFRVRKMIKAELEMLDPQK